MAFSNLETLPRDAKASCISCSDNDLMGCFSMFRRQSAPGKLVLALVLVPYLVC